MADSYNKYTGDGSTTNFSLTYSFISRDHVKVYVDEVDTAFTWISDSVVQVSPAPAVDTVVNVKRETPRDTLLVDFQNSSVLVEADLDLANQQAQYVAQEAFDASDSALQQNLANQWDAESKQIKNVADPTDAQDAATKNFVETSMSSQVVAAAASATAAATSESNAATSETNAASSETNAASSAAAASTSETNAGTSETNAASSAASASTSETNAATSETNAASSETNAASSETAAALSETNAAASYDSFDDRYLGSKTSNPTLDNDGNALLVGALYWNSTSTEMRVWTGSAWQVTYSASTFAGISDTATGVVINLTDTLISLDVKLRVDGTTPTLEIDRDATTGYSVLDFTTATVSDWQIYTQNAASPNLIFYAGGSARMTMQAGGNVGIGTSSPSSPLDVRTSGVSGTVAEFHNSGGFGIQFDVENAPYEQMIYANTNGSLLFGTNGSTERMRINTVGNVGIGGAPVTTSANTLLQLNNTVTFSVFDAAIDQFNIGVNTINNAGDKYIQTNSASLYTQYDGEHRFYGAASGTAGTAISFTEGMRILKDGKVGIGETAPLGKLHVKTDDSGLGSVDASSDELVLESSGHTGLTILSGNIYRGNITFADGDSNLQGLIRYNHSDNHMALWTSATEKVRVTSAGDVGIGTSAPHGRLHVETASLGAFTAHTSADEFILENTLDCGMTIMSGSTYAGYLMFGDSGDSSMGWVSYDHGGNYMRLAAGNAEAVRIVSSGNVGIGETTPLGNLHVKSADSGVASVNAGADELVVEGSGSSGISILSGIASDGQICFGDSDDADIGKIQYTHNDNTMKFTTGATLRGYFGGGFVVGSPTGGDKGISTINAKAVYDDNVLLTCYVFDQAVEGNILESKWDDKVPNTIVPATKDVEESEELRTHEPMRKFKSRIGTEYDPMDIDGYAKHWKDKKHLTSMPNETNYDPINDKMDMGNWIQRLIETVEIQAVHIETLNQRLKATEKAVNFMLPK